MEFDGPLGGSGLLIKSGPGTLTLTNSAGAFSGTVRIGAGALQLTNSAILQSATLDMNAADAGALNTAGLSSLALGGLMGARNLTAPAGPLTIGFNNSSTTYSGNLSGATSLTKLGTGALTLTTSNTYGGPIALNAGALVAANGSNGSVAGGPLVLNGGTLASGTLGGTIGGTVTAGSGAFQIAPGGSGAIGNLTIGGSLGLGSSATLDFDVSGNSADLLTIDGAFSVNGTVNLALSAAGTATASPIVLAMFPANNSLSAGNFKVTGVPSGYNLKVDPTNLELVAAPSGAAIWTSPSSGNWSDGTRWSTGSAPGSGKGAVAVVGTDTSTPITVVLDVATTLGQLTFSSTAGGGYTLAAGGGTLTMDNGTTNNGIAQILVSSGSHGVSAPVILAGALSIVPTAGTALGVSGNISEAAPGTGSLSLDGPGTLILGGSDSYTGGTRVTAGTLIVTSSNSLADNTNLNVAGGGTFIFDPSLTAVPAAGALTAAAAPASAAAAVPEPGTLALLGAAGIIAGAAAWRRRRKASWNFGRKSSRTLPAGRGGSAWWSSRGPLPPVI